MSILLSRVSTPRQINTNNKTTDTKGSSSCLFTQRMLRVCSLRAKSSSFSIWLAVTGETTRLVTSARRVVESRLGRRLQRGMAAFGRNADAAWFARDRLRVRKRAATWRRKSAAWSMWARHTRTRHSRDALVCKVTPSMQQRALCSLFAFRAWQVPREPHVWCPLCLTTCVWCSLCLTTC